MFLSSCTLVCIGLLIINTIFLFLIELRLDVLSRQTHISLRSILHKCQTYLTSLYIVQGRLNRIVLQAIILYRKCYHRSFLKIYRERSSCFNNMWAWYYMFSMSILRTYNIFVMILNATLIAKIVAQNTDYIYYHRTDLCNKCYSPIYVKTTNFKYYEYKSKSVFILLTT